MRPIDADNLLKALNNEKIQTNEIIGKARKLERMLCIQYINTEPTVNERPQGEWLEVTKGIDSNTYKCPFCGRLINCDKPRLKLYPFCHCGADMRGDEE
jgi:hypothetical protein